jgi:hypothetical protein
VLQLQTELHDHAVGSSRQADLVNEGLDGAWDQLDVDFEDSISAAADAQAIANGKAMNFNSDRDSGSITAGSDPPPGTFRTWQYSATQTATLSWSGQWLFNTTDGQYSAVPGFGVGMSLTITNDDDVPLFTTTFGVGKYGGASIGFITGYNVFTGFPDYAGIVITGGFGFAPSPYSVSWPQ